MKPYAWTKSWQDWRIKKGCRSKIEMNGLLNQCRTCRVGRTNLVCSWFFCLVCSSLFKVFFLCPVPAWGHPSSSKMRLRNCPFPVANSYWYRKKALALHDESMKIGSRESSKFYGRQACLADGDGIDIIHALKRKAIAAFSFSFVHKFGSELVMLLFSHSITGHFT